MRISKHVRTSDTPDGAVLMNIKGGSMLTLNPIGSIVWQRLNEGRTPTQIAVQLASEFGISQEQAYADVNEFVEQLRAHELIEPEEFSPSSFVTAKPTGLFCNLFGKRNAPPAHERGSK
jgi:hypothetical protein